MPQEKTEEKESRLTVSETLKMHGMSLESVCGHSAYIAGTPATCSHGCFVEPDGTCRHGHDSVLRVAGMI